MDANIVKLRAWWAHRQGLDGSLRGGSAAGVSAEEVLAGTGWARSVGGSGPYLGLFARAGIGRQAIDDAVADLGIHELPAARGCTYVVPRADFALALSVGASAPEGDIAAAAKKTDVTREEIDRLGDTIVAALDEAGRPLDPKGIKDAVGDVVRKAGSGTTLPLALGLLQAHGRVRRVPVNGRLDQQRFTYVRWTAGPLTAEPDPGAAYAELAARYFSWAAPASLKHFRWFSGLTAKAAKAAVEPLGLEPVEGTDLLLPPDLVAEFTAFEAPGEPHYTLVSGIDGLHLLHRDLGRLLDPEDAARPSPGEPSKAIGDRPDPETSLIVDRGRIAGLWEYDPDAAEIVHLTFGKPDRALLEAVDLTQAYVRDQLGDVRTYSLDSPKARAPRIAALRAG